jgi:hypothetical protein
MSLNFDAVARRLVQRCELPHEVPVDSGLPRAPTTAFLFGCLTSLSSCKPLEVALRRVAT